MHYRNLTECVIDLERHRHLVRVSTPVDPNLEAAEIQRRAYAAGAPAILLENVGGTAFPALCNLFGSAERCRFLFRRTLDRVARLVRMQTDPTQARRDPRALAALPGTLWTSWPRRVRSAPILAHETTVDALPQIRSWPDDGGPFVTLPQVLSTDPHNAASIFAANIGMYRIQMAGNRYAPNREVGLHCQIQRGIGVHLAAAKAAGTRLPVTVAVGGPPAHSFAAVMPLPEGLSESVFAGMLGGRRYRYVRLGDHLVPADADFCIVGSVDPERTLPEGPFGDHLGYYSLEHEFPVIEVERVLCRAGAIWPFTVVGRPPQEDTVFGELIHELVAPAVPSRIPGLEAMHAVDAAGVHPLMLALGRESYVPHEERQPRELLTVANAVLGFGQASLAKYLWIAAREDDPELSVSNEAAFFAHVLARVDWRRDLHFQTRTTIDTLDYSGSGLNAGSKLVVAAAGAPRRELARELPALGALPAGFAEPRLAAPGILVLSGPSFESAERGATELEALAAALEGAAGDRALDRSAGGRALDCWPLWVVCDDSEFTARTFANFLWVTFTRSNPAVDVQGVASFIEHKHWGCRGPLIIDARLKPHHAPPLVEDPRITARVDALAAAGGPLHGVI